MRDKLDKKLDKLNSLLIEMGDLVTNSINNATKALIENDKELAKTVITLNDEINEKEREIEALCLKLILQHQPVASDLREVSAALKMITDLERIGDQSADIAEIVSETECVGNYERIVKMAGSTVQMVKDSIKAYVEHDLELANKVIEFDDVVDNLFLEVKKEMIENIRTDKGDAACTVDLLMIAKYFERIGDHCENIAEWVNFSITGTHKNNKVFR